MTYPHSLIPIPSWKLLITMDSLSPEEKNFSVVRRISGNLDELMIRNPDWFVDKGNDGYALTLNADIPDIGVRWMPKMSMNILSDICGFEESSFRHDMLDEKNDQWKGNWVNPREFAKLLRNGRPCYFLEINANLLHGHPAKYDRTFNSLDDLKANMTNLDEVKNVNEKKREIVKNVIAKSFRKDAKYLMCGSIMLVHNPTPLNYWHIMMDIGATDAKKGWRYDLGRTVNTVIRNYGRIRRNDSQCPRMNSRTYRLNGVADWKYIGHRVKQYLSTIGLSV